MKRTALITGGSRGIGFAIAQKLGALGYNLVLSGTSPKNVHADNFLLLENSGVKYEYVRGNVANDADRRLLLEKCLTAFGRIDALINNAGIAPKVRADLMEMSEESYDAVMAVNLKGALFLAQLAAKQMIAQTAENGAKGVIVNISSMSAYTSSVNRAEYCISKAGLSMVTSLFADRLASEGIAVYEVRPGIIKTDMTSKVKDKYDALFEEGICPIARWGKPEDVAKAVAALASGAFGFSTGEVINVDGGFHITRL